MIRIVPILFLTLLLEISADAQSGVNYVYDFLSLPSSARETALGGSLVSIADEDLSLGYANPALLNEAMHNRIYFSHNFLFDGISNGYFAYGRTLPGKNITLHGAIKYINYGEFVQADLFGNKDGTFSANELAFILGGSRGINDRINIASNIKLVRSQLAGYNSTGIAADIGFLYKGDNNLNIAFTARNIGSEISSYTGTKESSPLDIQVGVSKQLAHLPFRFSVIFHQLHRWNLRYDSPLEQETDIFGNIIETSSFSREIDNLFRHVIFNGELLLGSSENFRIRVGYNHLRKKELSVSGFRSLGGFSFGFGIKVSKFRLDYGVGHYHLAGAANHLSVSFDLDDFFRKKL